VTLIDAIFADKFEESTFAKPQAGAAEPAAAERGRSPGLVRASD
jgi:hypothetical protein